MPTCATLRPEQPEQHAPCERDDQCGFEKLFMAAPEHERTEHEERRQVGREVRKIGVDERRGDDPDKCLPAVRGTTASWVAAVFESIPTSVPTIHRPRQATR